MKYTNLLNWPSNPELEFIVFFFQRMEELIFEYTLDSYKPKMMNSSSLCTELIETISEVENGNINAQNLPHIFDEFRQTLHNDKIAKSILPLDISQYFKGIQRENLTHEKSKSRLNVLEKSINIKLYKKKCEEIIIKSIKDKSKKEIHSSSGSYITTLLTIGYSRKYIQDQIKEFIEKFNSENPDDIVILFQNFNTAQHKSTCYFRISGTAKEIGNRFEAFDCSIIEDVPDNIRDIVGDPSIKEAIVSVNEVIALDVYSAQEIAEERIRSISNLYSLFRHKNKLAIKSECAVDQCCLEGVSATNKETNVIYRGMDQRSAKAQRKFDQLLKNFSMINNDEAMKDFFGITALHGICIESDDPNSQLLNLWIALESICPSGSSDNKIRSIINGLIPILHNNYVKKICLNYGLDLNRFRFSLIKDVSKASKGGILEAAIKILSLDEYAETRSTIYQETHDFPLMKFRTFQLHEQMKSRKQIKSMLENHMQRVEWQIRRIYRTRNLLVHSNGKVRNVRHLVENAHWYLDTLLDTAIRLSCSDIGLDSFKQVFEQNQIMMHQIQDELSKDEPIDSNLIELLLDAKLTH